MKPDRIFLGALIIMLLLIPVTAMKAAIWITAPAPLDTTDKIMRILYALAALITLFFLNFYRKKRK